jgi:hypothetical protein
MLYKTFHEQLYLIHSCFCKQRWCIFFCMRTPYTTQRKKHKPGPKPMAEEMTKASFVLPLQLWEWAVEQPEGASRLIRDFIAQERERRRAPALRED